MHKNHIPLHIAIIMDGNARWARMQGLDKVWGHRRGADTVKKIVKYCSKVRIKYLSLFGFSTENWSRPREEIDALMDLFVEYIKTQLPEMKKNSIRFFVSGRRDELPETVKNSFIRAEKETAGGKKLNLIFCVNYGGRQEIVDAAREASRKEGKIADFLYLPQVPDVDLLIRTSGEQRISNFLLWKIAYSELYFSDVLWPNFNEREMDRALKSYSCRQRKFGKRI